MGAGTRARTIWELLISADVDAHIWERHQIDSTRLHEIISGHYIVTRNWGGRAATQRLIGSDFSGQCYVVPIRATDDPHVWSVVAAWTCAPQDRDRLARS